MYILQFYCYYLDEGKTSNSNYRWAYHQDHINTCTAMTTQQRNQSCSDPWTVLLSRPSNIISIGRNSFSMHLVTINHAHTSILNRFPILQDTLSHFPTFSSNFLLISPSSCLTSSVTFSPKSARVLVSRTSTTDSSVRNGIFLAHPIASSRSLALMM